MRSILCCNVTVDWRIEVWF